MAPKKAEKGKAKADKGEKAEKTAKAVKGTVSKKVTLAELLLLFFFSGDVFSSFCAYYIKNK